MTKKEKIKVGVVGAGGIAGVHAQAWTRSGLAEVVAFADPVKDRAEGLAERYGAAAFADLDQMLAAGEYDLVDVCTPETWHTPPALQALNTSTSVLTEKIMAHTLADGCAMAEAARTRTGFAGVQYNYRHMPGLALVQQTAEGGTRGTLRNLQVTCCPECFHHLLDSVLWIGGTPRAIFATAGAGAPRKQMGVAEEICYQPAQATTVIIEFESGLLATINTGVTSHRSLPFSFVAMFDDGDLVLSDIRWPKDVLGRLVWFPEGEFAVHPDTVPDKNVQALSFDPTLKEAARRVRDGEAAEIPWEQGYRLMLVSHAIVVSAGSGQWVPWAEFSKSAQTRLQEVAV